MPPGGIRTHDLSRRAVVDLRLIPQGHWDRHTVVYGCKNCTLHMKVYTNYIRFEKQGSLLYVLESLIIQKLASKCSYQQLSLALYPTLGSTPPSILT